MILKKRRRKKRDSEIECHTHNIPKNSIHIPKNNVGISMDLGVVHWYL